MVSLGLGSSPPIVDAGVGLGKGGARYRHLYRLNCAGWNASDAHSFYLPGLSAKNRALELWANATNRTLCKARLEESWIDIVPSCRPRHFAFAPIVDCSALDTWLSLLPTDCSAFHNVCPALDTDLTRHPLLDARCCLRIAPLAARCACAGHESLRVTDCSVFST
jgi:hypothetical protein